MNRLRSLIKEHEKMFALSVSLMLCAGYFFAMLRFYLIEYHVPDFRLYGSMAVGNRKAADGFSSLFIWFAAISRIMPRTVAVACLFMLSASIFNFLAFYIRSFYTSLRRFFLVLCMMFSCGIWYYFYGKIFYDFPFSVFTYSLCLVQIAKIIEKKRENTDFLRDWILLFALFGLTLSWKPYNVFMLAGLLLCALAKSETRTLIATQLVQIRVTVVSAIAFVAGYVFGNFNLLVSPRATIKGIMAYPASYNFREFLYGKHRIIWDHVNDLPFCITVFSLSALFILFVVVPIVSKRKKYVPIFAVMFFLLRAYIKHFSPGYAWHGLPFGVFLLTLLLFYLSEKEAFAKPARILFCLALGIQACVTFGLYLPTQTRWHNATQKAISVLETQNTKILNDVEALVSELGNKTFYIDEPIKRYAPVARGNLHIRRIRPKQPYIIYDDIWYPSPLENVNSDLWEKLFQMENSTQYTANPYNFTDSTRYMVYVVPNPFKQLVDVADIFRYENFECIKCVKKTDYTIYVYDTEFQSPDALDSLFDGAEDVQEAIVTQ